MDRHKLTLDRAIALAFFVLVAAIFAAPQGQQFSSNIIGRYIVLAPRTYFVCGKANGATCGSTDPANGWNGNASAAPTIADTNDCRSVTTPCQSFAGIYAKANPIIMLATVTVYAADGADTGSDCYSPQNLVWTGITFGLQPVKTAMRLDAYPSVYLHIYGNKTMNANAPVSAGCGSSTAAANDAFIFDGSMAVVIEGFQFRGYDRLNSITSDAFGVGGGPIVAAGGAHVYANSNTYIGDTAATNVAQTYALTAVGQGSMVAGGLNQAVSGGMGWITAQPGAEAYTYSPADSSASATVLSFTCPSGVSCGSDWFAEGGHVHIDRIDWTDNGAGSWKHGFTILGGSINEPELYAGLTDCPYGFNGNGACVRGNVANTIVAGNYIFNLSDQQGSWIDEDCSNTTFFVCTVNVQPTIAFKTTLNGTTRQHFGSSFTLGPGNWSIASGGCISMFTATFKDFTLCGSDIPAVNNSVFLTADFTDSSSAVLQAITGLTYTWPASLGTSIPFVCKIAYSQATNVSDAFGIQVSGNTPGRVDAFGWMNTSSTAQSFGALANLTTSTATAIVTATPTVTTTLGVILSGTIKMNSNTTVSTIQIMVSQATAADVIVIKAGSGCTFGVSY